MAHKPDSASADQTPHYVGHRQRLRMRLLEAGPDALQDYELLEYLLCLAVPRKDMKPLAKALLKRFGGLADVMAADAKSLKEIKGVSDGVLGMLAAVRATGLRQMRAGILEKPVISSWQALLDYCRAAMARQKVEQFRILFLDRKNKLIADEVQQTGTVDHTPVYPREVIKRALELHASALILVHNHPSGDPTPSRADIDMTKEIAEAGSRLGIQLHDHLIIAATDHVSFKSVGLL